MNYTIKLILLLLISVFTSKNIISTNSSEKIKKDDKFSSIKSNLIGISKNPNNDLSEHELRIKAFKAIKKKKLWLLLPTLGKNIKYYDHVQQMDILEMLGTINNLNQFYPDWPEILNQIDINSLPLSEYKIITYLIRKNKNKNAITKIFPLISHPFYSYRIETYKTLAEIKDDRMYPLILKLINSPQAFERTYALSALTFIKDERLKSVTLATLTDKNKMVRIFSINAITQNNLFDARYHLVQIARNDPNNEVRIASIKYFTEKNLTRYYDLLNEHIKDPHPAVRLNAIIYIKNKKYTNAVWNVSKQLELETDYILQNNLVETLLQFDHSGAGAGFASKLSKSKYKSIRLKCAIGLAKLNSRRFIGTLIDALGREKEKDVLLEIIWALEKSQSNLATLPLSNILINKAYKNNYLVTASVLNALVKINDSRAIMLLFQNEAGIKNNKIRYHYRLTLAKLISNKLR